MPSERIVAVIPARGGSVSIPKKNIKSLAGRPLIDWVIKPALQSGVFAEVWVSTDDDEIEKIALACGAKVHRRSPSTATSTASTESALVDFVEGHPDYDVLCLIQAPAAPAVNACTLLLLPPPRARPPPVSALAAICSR